jgi:predicted mannosyl-3-phosphoglycerate phosphatase (HAD superfamily)
VGGAALFVPLGYFADPPADARQVGDYHVCEFGPPYWEVVLTLHLLASRLHIDVVGFSELSVEEIASTWHLSLDRARLAKLREYDEPFRVVNPGRSLHSRLMRAVRAAGLSCLAGERFQHVNGVLDPGASIERLRTMYERTFCCPVLAVGLGSSLCDLALLNEVDLPIIVRDEWSSTADVLFRAVPIARIASSAGAGVWSQAVIKAVRTIQKMRRAGALPA